MSTPDWTASGSASKVSLTSAGLLAKATVQHRPRDQLAELDRKLDADGGHVHRFTYPSTDRAIEYANDPTIADVLRYIFGTTMLMLVRKDPGGNHEYLIDVQHCKVHMVRGPYHQELRSWSTRFTLPAARDPTTGYINVGAGRVLDFTINGASTSNPQRMLAVLHTYYGSSQHPKLHVVAEAVMHKIETDQIKELYPSLMVTRSLHDMLLHSPWSPVGAVWSRSQLFPITKASMLTESLNWADFTHSGMFLFHDKVPFAHFMWIARKSVIQHTHEVGLDMVHAELLFVCSIAHAVDHHCTTKLTEKLRFPVLIEEWNTTSWPDLLSSACSRFTFMAPTLNPLRANLMKSFPPESVYGKIYRDIRAVNQEWADVATASIMY
ncbi:hypothetical protein AMAG_03008 [Allomyces macrogynus ATCC 38327]|uniref:Uncharacterized protein n=1 Tax=Allomyces macrogynus (strain ATCC 38327) TaxID=578462 RepID=A0A0L0S4E8_ALLM3|nr:hypothetical protein AMAG_03008 [Allomyces macrogynus ATCC 38327]|eukprot:KNE57276.1 hypothetical protein AMAG_03008 [Allomyces macrogynus ATCC 38327]